MAFTLRKRKTEEFAVARAGFFLQLRIWSFQVVDLQRKTKKCTHISNTRASDCSVHCTYWFFDVHLALGKYFEFHARNPRVCARVTRELRSTRRVLTKYLISTKLNCISISDTILT